jgi:cell division septation protein DedD
MLVVAGGLLGALVLAGALAWGLSRSGPRSIPVIEADSRPMKIRPEVPGGLVVPNQDQLVLEPLAVRRALERNARTTAQLDQGPEAPALDLLREHVTPPVQPQVAAPALPEPALPEPGLPVPAEPRLAEPVAAAPPPRVLEPVAAPPVAAAPAGQSMVQLGALSTEEAARAEWARLQRRVPELAGLQPRVIRLDRPGQPTLYRLRAVGLPDTAAARVLCESVRLRSGQCIPVGG